MVAVKSTLDDISTEVDLQRDKIDLGQLSARLQSLLDEREWKQVDLARESGESTSTISNYIRALKVPSAPALISIADALGVRPQWLLAGKGDRFERSPEAQGDHAIPIINTIEAIKTGLWNDQRVFEENMLLDDNLLAELGRPDTHGLIAVRNEGEANLPRIADGGLVVVDRLDRNMREGVFAYRIGDHFLIRRLRRVGMGDIEAAPFNRDYQAELYTGDLQKAVAIIGRCIWTSTKL